MTANHGHADAQTEAEVLLASDRPLSTAQVAYLFGVHPKTVGRWQTLGLLPAIRTPGGHRRYPVAAVREFLEMFRSGTVPPAARE